MREFPFGARTTSGEVGRKEKGGFQMKDKSGGGEAKSPGPAKKAGGRFAGMWRSMTGKRGGAAAQLVKGRYDALVKGRDDASVEGSIHDSVEGRSDASTRKTNDTPVEGRVNASGT